MLNIISFLTKCILLENNNVEEWGTTLKLPGICAAERSWGGIKNIETGKISGWRYDYLSGVRGREGGD